MGEVYECTECGILLQSISETTKGSIMAKALNRTPPKQIEHWAKIGGIMEDNPDLPYEFVRQSIIAEAEREAGKLESYVLHLDDMDQHVCIFCAEDLGLFEEG